MLFLFKRDFHCLEAQGREQGGELAARVLFRTAQVGRREALPQHLPPGFFVEAGTRGIRPRPTLEKHPCAGLVNEIPIQQLDHRQAERHRVAMGMRPPFAGIGHVNAETRHSRVNRHQAVVGKNAPSGRVCHDLALHGKEFPLPDTFYPAYFLRSQFYPRIKSGFYRHAAPPGELREAQVLEGAGIAGFGGRRKIR